MRNNPPTQVSNGVVWLVVNADDFGLATGINRGIVDAHRQGIVTSASLMVGSPGANEAASMSRDCPDLGVGLHFVATDDDGTLLYDLKDPRLMASLLEEQTERFIALTGSVPSHLDSHHHIHRKRAVRELFMEFATEHGIPLREMGTIHYHGFYGQWKWGVTDLDHIGVDYLQSLLEDLGPGAHEIGCHPGYLTNDYTSLYYSEREFEIATLTDARIQATVEELGIRLVNYRDLPARMFHPEEV